MYECKRPDDAASDCPECGARPSEECGYAGLSPELLAGTPITAGQTGVCSVDNPECESCQ